MVRRFAFLLFAVAATLQTGCCGRVHAFFYRLTHCDCCTPYYGGCGCAAPMYNGPTYGGAPCCASPAVGTPTMASPVFTAPQPMPGGTPNVYPSPMGEPKKN
jgi:hypothetical protein